MHFVSRPMCSSPSLVLLAGLTTGLSAAQVTELTSTDNTGAPASVAGFTNNTGRTVSADGRFAVFEGRGTNLPGGPTPVYPQIYVHDRVLNVTKLVSAAVGGGIPSAASVGATISADGRYIVYTSNAGDVVANDTNFTADVFRYDQVTGTTVIASVGNSGVQGNGASAIATVSNDGQTVAFFSASTNLTPEASPIRQVYVHDFRRHTTVLASVDQHGVPAASPLEGDATISGDGQSVTFPSKAPLTSQATDPAMYATYVRNLRTHTTTLASIGVAGALANRSTIPMSISGDGRRVLFWSSADNLVSGDTNGMADVFVRDLTTGITTRVNLGTGGVQGDRDANFASLSDDGKVVAFATDATNVVPGDANHQMDVFVRDLTTGTVVLASVANNGRQSGSFSQSPTLNSDGSIVAFNSFDWDLASGAAYASHGSAQAYVRVLRQPTQPHQCLAHWIRVVFNRCAPHGNG